MTSSPRIYREIPNGPITQAEVPIAVIATFQWQTGDERDLPAVALAWTREAVQVSWTPPGGGPRTDWIAAHTVRRAEGADLRPRDPGTDGAGAGRFGRPPANMPPRSTDRRRPRW